MSHPGPRLNIVSGLSEGQVLQRLGSRGATAEIAGTVADAGSIVVSLFKGRKRMPIRGWSRRGGGIAAQGKFTVKLAGIPAGGPYRLQLECASMMGKVAEFFVGDVWLMAGQSNMEGVGNREGAAKPHPLIRSFTMRREWRLASDPLHVLSESPDPCHHGPRQWTGEEAEEFRRVHSKGVGVGLFFARDMLKRTGVPQGLVSVAHGGTSMSQWDAARKKLGGESLYASALASVRATGQPIAGILWYQGESDGSPELAALYTRRMKALVAAFRRDLHVPRLPWVTVQIARASGLRSAAATTAWNFIQEQQRLLPGLIPRLETVSAIDLGLDDGIHISAGDYPRLAKRMARAAARLVYGERGERRPPQFQGVSTTHVSKTGFWWIDVHFRNVVGRLRSAGRANGFAVVGPDGADLKAIFKITLEKSFARLHVSLLQLDGLRLHYGLGAFPYCNITDERDEALPVLGPVAVPVPGPLTGFGLLTSLRPALSSQRTSTSTTRSIK